MVGMGDTYAAHPGAVVGPVQPADEFGANAAPHQAASFLAQALARDDQHDPKIALRRPLEKLADGAFSGLQGHAVQIERGLGRALAA